MTTEVHRVVLYVVDHDQVGAADVREMLEHTRYPNRCIAPRVVSVETQAVEWDDDHPLNTRATAAAAFAELFPARAEHAQQPASVPGVEEAIRAVQMRSFEYGGAVDARPVEASYDALRAAIAQATHDLHATVARAIHDQDTVWQAHDLERDAEVARWQREAHALVQAIKSIALTAGVDDVPNGDGWAERMTTAIRGVISKLIGCARTQADEMARAVEAAEDAAFLRGRDAVRKFPDGWGLIARPTPDEARRLVDEYDRATRNSYVTGGPEALRAARTALVAAIAPQPQPPAASEARRSVEALHLDLLATADTVAALHGAVGTGLRSHCVAAADKLRLTATDARTALLRALGVEA